MCMLVLDVKNPSVVKKISELRKNNVNVSDFVSNLFFMHEMQRKKEIKAHGSNFSKHVL